MSTGPKTKHKSLIALILAMVVVVSALSYFAFGVHTGTVNGINYTEKTLFVANDTLIDGNFARSTSSGQSMNLFKVLFDPADNTIFLQGQYNIYAVNTTSNHIAKTFFPANNTLSPGELFYDPVNGNMLLISYPRGVYGMINSTSLEVSASDFNESGVAPVTYNPANSEFYAIGEQINDPNVYVLNENGDLVSTIYIGTTPIDMAYNSYNHDVYVGTFRNITVIGPDNNIVSVIPLNGVSPDSHLIYVPSLNSAFQTQTLSPIQIAEINCSSNQVQKYIFDNYTNSGLTYIAVNGSSSVMLVSGDYLSVVYDYSHTLGTVPAGNTPYSVVYDPVNGLFYAVNQNSGTVSILNVWVTSTQVTSFSLYSPFASLISTEKERLVM
jgi:DNA-binding beta-propeller fold protein YncE